MSASPNADAATVPGHPLSTNSLRHPLTRALLLLTLTTGVIDAASFLGPGTSSRRT